MTLSQTLKAILVGFCFGVGIVWLLAAIIPLTMGLNSAKFIHDCSEDISSMSVLSGGISSVLWLILAARRQKKKKKEELENEMLEYFRKQNGNAEKD